MLDITETSEAASTMVVAASHRLQPYRFIHKALRTLMFRTLQQVATLDAALSTQRAEMLAVVEELLRVCTDHLMHENSFMHTPLRERAPRSVLAFDDDHQDHERSIAALRTRMHQVAEGGSEVRAAAYALYLDLSRFVGENLEHMADEETRLTQALWQHFSDAEIDGLVGRLQASMGPEENTYYLRWMARSLDDAELDVLARQARAAMPPEAFAGFIDMLASELPAPRSSMLAREWDVSVAHGHMGAPVGVLT